MTWVKKCYTAARLSQSTLVTSNVPSARHALLEIRRELRRFDGMMHNFVSLPEVFDDATTAREWAVARLRTAFEGAR